MHQLLTIIILNGKFTIHNTKNNVLHRNAHAICYVNLDAKLDCEYKKMKTIDCCCSLQAKTYIYIYISSIQIIQQIWGQNNCVHFLNSS